PSGEGPRAVRCSVRAVSSPSPGWRWHLGGVHQVAGRFVGPEPSAPLSISLVEIIGDSQAARQVACTNLWGMHRTLLDAYRRTAFVANTPRGRLSLRIGQRSRALDELLPEQGVTTWTY